MNSKLSKILELIKNKQLILAENECLKLLKENINNHEYYNIYSIVCFQLEKYDLAIKNWQKAIQIKPNYFVGYNNIGKAFLNLNKYQSALENFNKTIEINPNFFEAYNNKGNVLTRLNKPNDAIENYNKAINLKPDNINSHIFKAHILSNLNKTEEALSSYEKAFKINPEYPLLFGHIMNIKSQICDWKNFNENLQKLSSNIDKNKITMLPFNSLVLFDSPSLQKKVSEVWSRRYEISVTQTNTFAKINKKGKIKLGYFTADFRDHATSHLTAEMFEKHDKSKFEIYGFYLGEKVSQNDTWHQRLKKSFNKFFSVNDMSDLEVSKLAMDLKIDIAIDLMTHCTNGMKNRFGVFVRRCAPVQINFLGYPGTSGSTSIDYIIADKMVIPEINKKYYSEKIIYLPNSYQPNSKNIQISKKNFLREDLGLPKNKFILCCFNQHQRISPTIFSIWMNILKNNSQSVIWLLEDNILSKKNLINEAEKKGIEKNRIIFAKRIEISDHLERIKLADLFLDTYPYSAHTTCSDALRSGLPVVTMIGKTFASRVASSLLTTMNLTELITDTYENYEKLINNLINDQILFKNLKEKVKINSENSILYDSSLFTKNIENAYIDIINNLNN